MPLSDAGPLGLKTPWFRFWTAEKLPVLSSSCRCQLVICPRTKFTVLSMSAWRSDSFPLISSRFRPSSWFFSPVPRIKSSHKANFLSFSVLFYSFPLHWAQQLISSLNLCKLLWLRPLLAVTVKKNSSLYRSFGSGLSTQSVRHYKVHRIMNLAPQLHSAQCVLYPLYTHSQWNTSLFYIP